MKPRLDCHKCAHPIEGHRDNFNGKRACDWCRCTLTQWFIAKHARSLEPTDEDRTARIAFEMGYRYGQWAAAELLNELADAVTALEARSIRSGGEFHVWAEERTVTEARDNAVQFLTGQAKP